MYPLAPISIKIFKAICVVACEWPNSLILGDSRLDDLYELSPLLAALVKFFYRLNYPMHTLGVS